MSAQMTWEQMLSAVQALGEASLRMRQPGDWYVEQPRVDKKERGSSVIGSAYGNGSTPEAAVRDHWWTLTDLKPNEIIVIDSLRATRRHVRWNGFMWVDEPVRREVHA